MRDRAVWHHRAVRWATSIVVAILGVASAAAAAPGLSLVGADGTVRAVETETDPSTGIKHKHVSPAAKCVAPIVKTCCPGLDSE